ncbi:hypothetical protein FIBSPDRAFT_363708 [Athelia psychrophila]|uniref:Uncharacterized protein n=1 Tax=Athelia psychrophila TaxID=1759441 RepID=A0A166PFZ0_9AGAM|nr:hypothetical protein FIBSPDRAFT_363708 [Fibularhizoctonia sp. CBS 109695]
MSQIRAVRSRRRGICAFGLQLGTWGAMKSRSSPNSLELKVTWVGLYICLREFLCMQLRWGTFKELQHVPEKRSKQRYTGPPARGSYPAEVGIFLWSVSRIFSDPVILAIGLSLASARGF